MFNTEHASNQYDRPNLAGSNQPVSLVRIVSERTKIRSFYSPAGNKWELFNTASGSLFDFLKKHEKTRFDLSFKAASGNQLTAEEAETLSYLNSQYDEMFPREKNPALEQLKNFNAEVRRIRANG